MERGESDLIKKYRASENLPAEVDISDEMIWHHWNLERELTRQLLDSTPENRRQVFEDSYTRFYEELPWLTMYTGKGDPRQPAERYRDWVAMIGDDPKRIYEIGSGSGSMLRYFAEIGHECTATEISRERKEKSSESPSPDLTWANSDGVHLDLFEKECSYDVVLSDQVIEHLHPDDVLTHFRAVFRILRPGGRYIFNTPHRYAGPHDVSQVFGSAVAQGMHLTEYTFRELFNIALNGGFKEIGYVIPCRLRDLARRLGRSRPSQMDKLCRDYLKVMLTAERFLSFFPEGKWRRLTAQALKKLKIFKSDIFLAARK